MRHKLDEKYVKKYFKDRNCILLDEYKTTKIKLSFKCSCGEIGKKSFEQFKASPRCKKCSNKLISSSKVIDQKDVAEYFKKEGCELIGNYINCTTPVDYKCNCGQYAKISFNNFKRGKRCKFCKKTRVSGINHHSWIVDRDEVKFRKKIRKKCYKALRTCYNKIGKLKENHAIDILGYSSTQLAERIKNHPNWRKVSKTDWELDHIFPIQAFIDHKIFDVKIINALDNLQPLSKNDNLKKLDNYNKEKFYKKYKDIINE